MKRTAFVLIPFLLLYLSGAAWAQQSNKSKSKDRYREKQLPAKSEIVRDVEQNAGLMQLAAAQLRPVTAALSEVVQRDAVSAPAASRIYAYAFLAGYQAASRYQPAGFPSLHGALNGMPAIHSFTPPDSVFYPLVALLAMLETGKSLLPSGFMLAQKQAELEQLFREKNLPEVQIAGSRTAAGAIARAAFNYAAADGYTRLSALPPYQPGADATFWQPAPGEYASEPYWYTLRPFFLESAQQFRAAPPAPFSADAGSPFVALAREVYDTGRNLTPEQRDVAQFWDEPNAPAGHWMSICGQACEQQKRSFREGLLAHTAVALAMADAFIACWDEKYRNGRLRPVAAVNRLFDAGWQPLLQTPATPEYVGEHAMVSAAAAEVLTQFLGDNRGFTDAVQTPYGPRARNYRSFRQAAAEAANSRLYGGVQFRDGLEQGLAAGRQLGLWTLSRLPVKQ